MPLISYPVPNFAIPAVSIKSPTPQAATLSDYAGNWLLLFFYPRDFSFVCPTELTSLSARWPDFERRNCRILGVSVDTIEMHNEWLNTPPADGGLGPLQFPLASDGDGAVAQAYGIWLPEKGVSARGLFLIDPQGILQYSAIHNLSVGRSVDEVIRLLDAMQSGGLCPVNWTTADGHIDPAKALQPGKVLGHYRIRRLLGEGTFGTVFAAWDLRLERKVALKVLMTGRRALSDKTLSELLVKVRNPEFPLTLANELPEQYRQLLIATLAQEPSFRPTADTVRNWLRPGSGLIELISSEFRTN